jgi:replicative DNA helicase
MLLSRDAIVSATEVGLGAEEFYKPAHGHVYDAITSLYGAGEPADPVTVAEELRRAGLLEAIGGPSLLVTLQASTPATSNAGRYARIISEHALLRRLIGVAGEIAEIGYGMPEDVIGAVDRAESMVFDVAQRRVIDSMSPIKDLLDASLTRLEMLYDKGDSITGLPSGYHGLDELMSGLQPSTLVVVGARPAMGKALALDTPIATPGGWSTMGALQVDDEVFDERGLPCRVTYTSPIFDDHRCYRIRFDDGSELVADAGHRWLAYDFPAWKSHRSRMDRLAGGPAANPSLARDQSTRMRLPRVVTTQDMLDEGVRTADGSRPNWYLPLASLDLPDAELPVDPYVLGCWLGDGTTVSSRRTIGLDDAPHFVAAFEAAGYALDHRPGSGPLTWGTSPVRGSGAWQSHDGAVRSLTRELQAVGLLRGATKHIPAPYLRASSKQRLALLQGLLDTDGTVTNRNGTVELCLANRALLEQAWELVASLGHKPHRIVERRIRLGDGRMAAAWRFRWTPLDPVFRMARKADLLAATVSTRRNGPSTRRAIVAIDEVPTVPMRCITVDSPNHLFLAGRAMIPTHNTAFALGMAAHAALEAHRPVLFFSLEMSHLELTQRLLSSEARVDSTRMRNGKLAEADWTKISHAIGRLAEAPLYFDDNPQTTVMEIRAKARRLKSRLGDLGLVVIDYLQLMTGRTSAENRQVEVSEISRGLKILARELECPVVALSQLSRGLEMRADKRPMLADLRESGCLIAETRLQRADTGATVTLGELLASGERDVPVWTLDERWRLVAGTLTHAFPSGTKPTYRLCLSSGREVVATVNHPFRTVEGWVPLGDLAVGDRLAVPRLLPEPLHPVAMPPHEIVLLAHLLGDGCVLPRQPVHYTSNDLENLDAVEEAAGHFGVSPRRVAQGAWWHTYLPAPGATGRGRRNPIAEWWDGLGLRDCRSGEKFVPAAIHQLPTEQVRLFLRHLWATDGSVTVRHTAKGRAAVRIYYSSTSRRLVDGVRDLLLRCGIQGRIRTTGKAGYGDAFTIDVSGVEDQRRFLEEIGVHGARSREVAVAQAALRDVVANPNVDTIPYELRPRLTAALAGAAMSHRALAIGLDEEYRGSYLLGSEARPRSMRRERLARIAALTDAEDLADLASSDVHWDRVVSIEPLGDAPVFDATVLGTHNFVADGIVVHNSIEQDADVVMFLYRDEVYNSESPDRGTAEILVAKHRSGPTGMDRLAFLDHYTRFANMARGM